MSNAMLHQIQYPVYRCILQRTWDMIMKSRAEGKPFLKRQPV